ncbi:hypothetical protein HDU81_000941 [Chytriomyces hyalinus]|nr:hypothetical protein HDU81_000941 [Chytriomyces hyalinus]
MNTNTTQQPETTQADVMVQLSPDADTHNNNIVSSSPELQVAKDSQVLEIEDILDGSGDSSPKDVAFDVFTQVRVPLSKFEFVCVFVSMMLGVLLAALDQTIVATALKAIVADLGDQALLPWIGSAHMLSSCALCTMYGKLADIFGRKLAFLVAVVVFEVGSLVCGIATSMGMLIAGRAIAGVGGGGIMSLVLIMLSDIVSIQDRGKYQGFIGGTYSIASVIGPLVGGAFVDNLSWRWCFFINLPIGFITFLIVMFLLKLPAPEGNFMDKLRRVDFIGITLLTISIVLLLVPLQLGGAEWAWGAWYTILCFVLSCVFFVVFGIYEGRVEEAIVPYALFSNTSVPALLVIAISIGASLFPAMYYISVFFQVVQGATATIAGVKSVPLIFGVVAVSVSSGLFVSKTGQYRILFFIGPVVMSVGIYLVSSLNQYSSTVMNVFYLLLFGMGVGPLNSIGVVAIQSSVDTKMIAVATAVQRTCQQLGGAFGVSLIGSIFNSALACNIQQNAVHLPEAVALLRKGGFQVDPKEVFQVVEQLQVNQTIPVYTSALSEVVEAFVGAFRISYLWLLPFPALILLANALFVRQFELKSKKK